MRRMKNLVTAVALVVIVGGMGAAARGQGIFSSSDFSGAGAYDYRLSSALHASSNADSNRAGNAGRTTRGATSSASRGVASRGAANASTTFRPVSGTILPQQMAAKLAKSPQDRQELEQAFLKCLNYYKEIANANGVALNDVARASSFYIEANYIVYSGSQGLTPEQGKGLRRSVIAALSEDANFQAMSAREKQKLYETAAIMGAYVVIGHDMAEKKNDRKAAAEFQQLAKESLEKLLGPIDKVRFTDNGIEFK